MADETKLFETKLLKLKDILLFLKGHKFAKLSLEQLNNLQMRLDKLKKNVEIEGTLNAGGKFEWVDSILIKCLQDGCWLLIENVNLCSPAVLDRLNALLEPNGVLTIGERGVDKNGEMIQIIPHPNFRLFLTMDPKNGEISRAMRNRGVEIYMLNEIESKDRNEFDTKAVIEQNGLNIEGLQEILLNLHDFISQTVLGEKPTVSNILQASFLISQQLLRGINIIDAFTSSLIDVYIKTRSINDFAINDPLNTIECYIKSTVQDYLKRSNELSSNYYNRTLKTMDLQNNSKFEIIKQQNILIQQYSQQWNYSIYFYLLSYFITSNNNLNIRYSHLLNESNQFNKDSNMLNEKLYSTMNDFFKKYISRDNKDMPLDYLSLKDTKEKYTNLCESNQMFLLSYFVILKTLNDSQLAEEIGKKFTKLTILQYSKAVFDKKLSKSTIDHPLIINLYKLIVNFDDYLIFILSTQNLKLTSEDTIFATLALNWRFVLQEIGNLIVYDKNNKKLNLNTILSQLIIRYKWFIKHTVRYFTKLSNPEQARRLEDVIELISTSVQNDFSNFSKISNRFVKNSPRPLPLTSEEQIDIMTSLENILNETSIMRKNNYNVQTKCYLIINIPEFSEKLIETRKEVRNNILNKENIEQLREYSSRCINKELKLTEIQLLPVKDFFALQIISYVQNIIFSSENITDEKCNILRKLTTVSPELNETLETYFATRNENLIPELTLLKTIYLKCAVSLVPSSYLSWNTENKNLKTLSTHVPILTYSVTNLCVSPTGSNDLVSVTNLERYKERSEQLSFLNELLWKNIPALSSDEFNFSKNDSVYIVHSFGRFIIFLEKCLTGQNSNAATTDIIQKCINKITEIYSSNIESEEMLRNKNKIMHIFDQLCLRIDKLKTAEDIDCLIHTANAYCLLNYLKALLNSQLQVIDPLEKKALKKQYCEEKRKICTNLKDAFVAQNEIFSGQIKTLHPFFAILSQKISECEDKETELGKLVAVRPSNITYQSLLKDVSHNLATLLSDDFFMKMYEKLNACILNLQEAINSNKDINLEQSRDVLNQSSSWMYSQENSYIKLLKYRVGYPDIIENLLSNITELSYGIKLLHTTLQKLIKRYENMNQDLNKFMENLVQFPVLSEIQRNIYSFIEMCTENKNINFVSKTISNEEIPNLVKQENLRMLKCGIQEMFNLIVTIAPIYLEPQSKMLLYLENLISLFVSAWCKQESEKQRREEEEQSLYKTKSICENLTEEEETERDMKLLFPNYHELDFSDFQEKQLTDTPEKITEESEIIGVISSEDVKFVSGIHSQLMQLFTKSEWLNPNTKKKNLEPNFVTPLLERYKVFSLLQEKLIEGLDNKIDENLISSLNLLVSITKHHGESDDELAKIHSSPRKSKEKSYDFYKDSKVEEIKSCLPVLEALKNRITELLINWPSHPTLQSIASIIDRIYSFSVISPISRFLTGFEILLSKCNEWEENAHTGVSLQEYSQNITLQIISWRKLELSGWRDGLNNAVERIKSSVSKWWFHIYSSINEFIENKESSSSTNKLIKLFQEFIEKSPLGEYENRLDLLFTFHCHSLHLPKSKNKNIVLSILWNLFHYYAQFIPNIDTKIKNLRLPIEKKLKDFVKIARWNDINYWSVKETVEKTHRTLHKYIKEFENSLKQGVSDCLVNSNADASSSEQVGIWDRPTRHTPSQYHYSLDASNYMASTKYKKLITDNNSSELEEISDSLLNKSEKYFSKSRSFCKDVISNTSYPHLIQNLDTFVTEIIETSNHLRSLEINKELDIKKRKSQAKSILQQKRKALADLFKTLTKCGLSYRTGIIEAKLREDSSKEFLLRPLDLNASLAHLKSKGACDKQLLNIWDGCETYFMRTIARLAGLESALKQPAQDLGLPNIERCKGFSFHLMILAQEQKSKLIDTTRNLYHLRNCVNLISEWDDESEMIKTETVKSVSNLLSNIIIVMEQYKIILLSCPEQPNFEADLMDIPVVNTDNQITIKYANDTNWNKCLSEIKIIISSSHKLKTTIDKLQNIYPASENQIEKSDYLFISDKDNLFSELRNLACKIESLQIIFGNNSISKSVNWLIKEIQANLELFLLEYIDDNESQVEVIKFKSDIEKLLEKTLVIIQNLYKKYQKKLETKEGSADETTINEEKLDTFEDNHLKNLVVENLFEDLSALEIKNIHKKVKKSIEKIFKMNLKDAKDCKLLLSQCIPLLEQIILLYQYFVTQQVSAYRVTCKLSSVLLNIFIELASKGFCVPQELSDEIDSEGQSNQVGGGMGLGEGEGEKDVSDRIESEDQLDDAQPAGQEKKNEDKNCREEDKGIEMSEDFEGQLQDVDKPEDDESKSDSDSDAEKQMGDTEKDSNQLDQKIWGSDDEIDDETDEKEQEKQDKEEKGEGGELEDLQMAAKEDGSKSIEDKDEQQLDNNDTKKEQQKDINEMDEPEYDEDQVDPYHGKQPPPPEPESMDLPDDLQLDDGEEKEEQDNGDENPFDIDKMKEQMPSEEQHDDEEKEEKIPETENTEQNDTDSNDEDELSTAENMESDKPEEKSETSEDKNDQKDSNGMQEKQEQDKKENEETETEDASAPDNQQSKEEEIQPMEIDNVEACDNVQTNPNQTQSQQTDAICQENNEEKDGVGQSQMEESDTGHHGELNAPKDNSSSHHEKEILQEKRQKPGESDTNRSLGETAEPVKKKLKTIDIKNKDSDDEDIDEESEQDKNADMYQHIKEAKVSDTQVMDVATKEQAETQKIQSLEEEDKEDVKEQPTEMQTDEPEPEIVDIPEQKTEKTESKSQKKADGKQKQGDIIEEMKDIEIEGERVDTMSVPRGNETAYHTQYDLLGETQIERLSSFQIQDLRCEIENQLGTWNEPPPNMEAEQTWEKFSAITTSLARDLSEQLRLVLEPTQASRLRGDFRTGRRINMRKVIPYIASQFRKDKIWLRRTKPSKREYQIVLAIDDSSSMADNHSKELAFESVALISKALSLLESGQLSVVSFGETTEILHKLTDTFTEKSGVKLLQKFQFQQKKTCVAKLVDFVTTMFSDTHTTVPNAKLLIVVSDGRGIFSEGETYVQQAIRRAKFSDIFMVFVIVDNPENKNSVLDIRMPIFKDGKLLGIKSYLDNFPFPFYIILQDINSLPSVLSDALRQWFELITNVDK